MGCPKCEEGVVVAPVADKVIEKGRPGPGLLAHTLTLKYAEHLPLTRIAEVFRRDGLDLGTSTLSDWVGAGANALVSIHGVERQIRRIAMGRKNWLFAGSDAVARRAVILYSIIGTCSGSASRPR